MSDKNKWLWKAAVLGAFVITVILLGKFLPIRGYLQSFSDWITQHGSLGVLLFMAVYVCATILLLPSAWFTIAAVVAFGFWQGLLIAATSASISAGLSFVISRYFARTAVEKWVNRSRKLKALDAAVGAGDWKVVLLCRLTPVVPFVFSNYFFGLTRLRFWPYFLASTAGIFPGALMYAYVGYVGKVALTGDHPSNANKQYVVLAIGLLATVGLFLYISRLAKRALASQSTSVSKE